MKEKDKMKDMMENGKRSRKDLSVVMRKIVREEMRGHHRNVARRLSVKTEEAERFVEINIHC